jgi:hypothetical protein
MFEFELQVIFSAQEIEAFLMFNQEKGVNSIFRCDKNYWFVYDLQVFINFYFEEERKLEIIQIAIDRFPQLIGYSTELN